MAEQAAERSGAPAISLGQLVALNDEIAALTRAGLPLGRGLRAVGSDVRGGLSAAMLRLSDRLERGEGLSEALAADKQSFPPLYRAVVEAGLRSGRLPAALESLASFVRVYDDARRSIGLAFWYPMMVLLLAYTLLVGMVAFVIPRLSAAFESMEVTAPASVRLLATAGESAWYWGPIFPLLAAAAGVWWVWGGRASRFPATGATSPMRWTPWMRSLIVQAEAANFAHLLSILIEHGVPYHQAVILASEASGDPALVRAGNEVAAAVERGDPAAAAAGSRAIPPLLRWSLVAGQGQGGLAESLRRIASIYRKRSKDQAEKIKLFLPSFLLIAIGATATLLYVLTFFVPLADLLRGLAAPQG